MRDCTSKKPERQRKSILAGETQLSGVSGLVGSQANPVCHLNLCMCGLYLESLVSSKLNVSSFTGEQPVGVVGNDEYTTGSSTVVTELLMKAGLAM